NPNGFPSDIAPILGWVFYSREKRLTNLVEKMAGIIEAFYKEAHANYQSGVVRHFTDAIHAAKEEAIAEERSISKYLTERNMQNVISDLFNAGSGTTRGALKW